MAVKSSGALSFDTDIIGEFKGSRPHSLSEYYAGGTLVPAGTKNGAGNVIPSAGAIKFSDFYGAAAQVVINVPAASIPGSGSGPIVINNIPANAGKVVLDIPLTAPHAGTVGGSGPDQGCGRLAGGNGAPGMEITIPAGTQVVLRFTQDIIGGGGGGGTGGGGCHQYPGAPGGAGGPGILVHGAPGSLTIDPSSTGAVVGGSGGGNGGTGGNYHPSASGGGGGGGWPNGSGGAGGSNTGPIRPPGAVGTMAGGGQGGQEGHASNNGQDGGGKPTYSAGQAVNGLSSGGAGGQAIQYV